MHVPFPHTYSKLVSIDTNVQEESEYLTHMSDHAYAHVSRGSAKEIKGRLNMRDVV